MRQLNPPPALTSVSSTHGRAPGRQAGVSHAGASPLLLPTQLPSLRSPPVVSPHPTLLQARTLPTKPVSAGKAREKASRWQAPVIHRDTAGWYTLDLLGQLRDLATEIADLQG